MAGTLAIAADPVRGAAIAKMLELGLHATGAEDRLQHFWVLIGGVVRLGGVDGCFGMSIQWSLAGSKLQDMSNSIGLFPLRFDGINLVEDLGASFCMDEMTLYPY
jgi:hypothetical protein